MTEFSNVNFPVYDIIDEIPDNLSSNLRTNGMRLETDGLVVPSGNPRYVKGNVSTLQPKPFVRLVAVPRSILMGTRDDL
jgi:hypothetical protein